MPEMQMGEMATDSAVFAALHSTEHAVGSDLVLESGPGSMHEISNCEQVCGYCVTQNLPAPDLSGLHIVLRGADNPDLYIPPAPTGYYRDLFRPPISV